MKANFLTALDMTLNHEGGWSDHPDDPGGATMQGVTLKTYSDYLGREATKDELRDIDDDEIEEIYKTGYWDKIRGDDIPTGPDIVMFDFAVNSGPKRAIIIAQRLCFADDDGIFGHKTLKRVWERIVTYGSEQFVEDYCDRRLEFLQGLSTFGTFGRGWTARVEDIRERAAEIARDQPI